VPWVERRSCGLEMAMTMTTTTTTTDDDDGRRRRRCTRRNPQAFL
jgi:hypothetical protein